MRLGMSNRKYVDRDGNMCPVCRGNHIQGKGFELIDSTLIVRNCVCVECCAEWEEEFRLVGYELAQEIPQG